MAEKRQYARAIQSAIQSAIGGQVWISTGEITEVRKKDRRIRVAIYPEMLETNYIRVFFPLAGPGYMIGALPEVGTEVLVVFMNGDINHAYAIAGGTFFDDDDIDPIDNDYDFVLKPKYGGWIKITKNDGILINTEKNIDISVTGNVTSHVKGDVIEKVDGKATLNCDNVHLGAEGGGKVLTSTTFMPKYNADMALVLAHTNLVSVDPTLATIGGATEALHAATKVDAK